MGRLIISRKQDESFRLIDDRHGTEILVTIGKSRGNHTGIAIDAPEHVRIVRSELADLPAGSLNNPELPKPRWLENDGGRKFAKRRR